MYVSDLDGTLLRSDGTLSEFSRTHLTRLLEAGLPFTVASARAVSSMQAVLPGLPIRLPVIAANGAVVARLDTGEPVAVHALDGDLLRPLYAFLVERGHVPFVAAVEGVEERLYYADLANEGMEKYVALKESKLDRRLHRVPALADCLGETIVAFALCDRHEPLAALAAAAAETFPGTVVTNFFEDGYAPGWFWLTMQNPRAKKDQALAELARELGYAPEDLVVFGDHWNDIPMFQLAGTAIAVGNATDELKAHATLVIGSNDQDSVVRYLVQVHGQEQHGP